MRPFVVSRKSIPSGLITLAGDKSIAHRAVILSSLCAGTTELQNFPLHQDSLATINVFRKLGVSISQHGSKVQVCGKGLSGLLKPKQPVFVNNSGTTLRLAAGVLAGQDFESTLVAGDTLSKRPMKRVNAPLRLMGAEISARQEGAEEYAPLIIKGRKLKGITYTLPVASAQVKSALLLAGLCADGLTQVIEPLATRDHTERMLKLFRVKVKAGENKVSLAGKQKLASPGRIFIPGDISSAAFFIVWAAAIPGARIRIEKVSLNPTRNRIISLLQEMKADIKVTKSVQNGDNEPMGDILVKGGKLKGINIEHKDIPLVVDELPILMVAASLAKGKTILHGVKELRVKETDRINSMVENLRKMGADIQVEPSGDDEDILIDGSGKLSGASVKSYSDHRTAMSMIIAGLSASGRTSVDDVSCVKKSFPDFIEKAKNLLEDTNF
ncbi:MAG: 3-phosphoshikimate 1-carboxyvinyltransferase [Candidatus Omnitrophota bacterium]|jgi:3-phosphoshikimate 1-carboxyvinyltransferase